MGNPRTNLRVILIGGSSHAGKSTVAESLAATLGWTYLSTDKLAAHPGRPWRRTPGDKVMDIVAEHYLNLSVDELMEDVLRHYHVNVWPQVEELIASYVGDTSANGLVLEGSALWPEFATDLNFDRVAALWLTAAEETFRQRIYTNSRYGTKPGRDRRMIDKFLQRTIAYDARMVEVVRGHRFKLLDVMESDVTDLAERCLLALGVDGK